MKLIFCFADQAVGHFIEIEEYPARPGRYRYMPYRGPGHLRFQEECARNGLARCAFKTAAGLVTFSARPTEEAAVVSIDDVRLEDR